MSRAHSRLGPLVLTVALSLALGPAALAADSPPPAPVPAPLPEPELLAVGTAAPPFTVVGHDGQKIDLAKLRGKYVVLYFYPRDDTSGCTKEACAFRDAWATLGKAGVVVLGVSTDSNESHKAFAEKHRLPFTLLPDEQSELAKKYRVPVVNGKARRITYLIGKDGKVSHVWPKVDPLEQANQILAVVKP